MVHHKLKGTGPKMKKIMQLLLIGVLCFAYSFSALADADESTVKKVQQALNEAGFDCGAPDGLFGSKTSGAVSEYQKSNGMEATGQIDDVLLVKLGLAESDEEDGPSIVQVFPDYEGEWVDISSEYEIFLPENMELKERTEEDLKKGYVFEAEETDHESDGSFTPTVSVEMTGVKQLNGNPPDKPYEEFHDQAGGDAMVINRIKGLFVDNMKYGNLIFYWKSDTAFYILYLLGVTEENEESLRSVLDTLRAKFPI